MSLTPLQTWTVLYSEFSTVSRYKILLYETRKLIKYGFVTGVKVCNGVTIIMAEHNAHVIFLSVLCVFSANSVCALYSSTLLLVDALTSTRHKALKKTFRKTQLYFSKIPNRFVQKNFSNFFFSNAVLKSIFGKFQFQFDFHKTIIYLILTMCRKTPT